MANIHEYANSGELDQRLAQVVSDRLKQAISHKGHASLVVSGGRTPAGLFNLLSKQAIDWHRVYITLADERWVAVDDDASNEKSVRMHLLKNFAEKAHFISLVTDADTPFDGCADIEQRLKTLPSPIDVVILGMGEDGHTASLFPQADTLKAALDLHSAHHCMGMMPVTAPYQRMTLTLTQLLKSEAIFLHIVGDNKKQVLAKALAGQNVEEMPIRAILQQQRVPVEVFWAK